MSRCFPFPPTGYMRSGSCNEALIESIKFQSKDDKAKKDRKKERRREKKEKRKERKGATSHSGHVKELKLIEPEKIGAEKSKGCLQNPDDYENEQLERSDITEEHNQPVSWLEPCCSDSIQSSNKRKRSVSPSSHYRGTGIKLRFSLKEHREPEEYKLDDHLGSTSRNVAGSSAQNTNGSHHQLRCVTNAERDQCVGNSDFTYNEKLQSSSYGAAPNTNTSDDQSVRVVSGYHSLFQNWVPPPLTGDGFLPEEDEDWLFSSQLQDRRSMSERVKHISGALRCSSPSLWPHAQYLPDVEIYALPYAVPF